MANDIHHKPGSVCTDPSAYSSAPPGSLRRGDDIVTRRDGVAEPRPGFEAASLSTPPSHEPRAMFAHDGDVLIVADDTAGGFSTRWLSDTSADVVDEDSAALDYSNENQVQAVEARENLYINAADGMRKVTAAGGTSAPRAGYPWVPVVQAYGYSGSGTAVADGDRVGYVALLKRIDANGVEVTGAPSGMAVYRNSTGGVVDVVLRVHLPQDMDAGDYIEIYRTIGATGLPSQEAQLLYEGEVSSSDISTGYFAHTDTRDDVDLVGEFLYTSPSMQGAGMANQPAPECRDLAPFRGSLFCFNTLGPQRLQTRWTEHTGGSQTNNADGVGLRDYYGIRTNGSNVITSMSATTGLEVGMILTDRASWNGSGVVRITAISAGVSVTMSETWGGTTDPGVTSIVWVDTVRIDSSYFPAYPANTLLRTLIQDDATYGTTAFAGVHGYALGVSDRNNDAAATYQVAVVLEELARGGAAFEVYATHGDEFEPPLPLPTAGSGESSKADDRPNGLAWSKNEEPEHWPLPYRKRVAGASHAGLRAIPTRDALWLFKTDGIWRLTGDGAVSGWQIDPFDRSAFLLAPKAAAVMNDTIYAWTNQGPVMVSDAGLVKLGDLHIGNQLRQGKIALGPGNTSSPGAFVVANPKDSEVIFGTVDASGKDEADELWVWNTKSETWRRWRKSDYSCGVLDPSDQKLKWGYGSSYAVDTERLDFDRFDVSDHEHGLNGATVTSAGASWSSTSPSGYSPAVGDLLENEETGAVALVTVVNDTTDVALDADISAGSEPAFRVYASFESVIAPIVRTARDPQRLKLWQDGGFTFGSYNGVERVTLRHSSSVSDTQATETRTGTRDDDGPPRGVYFIVPTDHATAAQLLPELVIRQAGAQWRYEQMSVSYRPLSGRVRQ